MSLVWGQSAEIKEESRIPDNRFSRYMSDGRDTRIVDPLVGELHSKSAKDGKQQQRQEPRMARMTA